MEKLLRGLFGLNQADRQIYEFKPGVKTTTVKNKLTFEQWCNEFRVSMLYEKNVRHFG
jgi:hypothetical protein